MKTQRKNTDEWLAERMAKNEGLWLNDTNAETWHLLLNPWSYMKLDISPDCISIRCTKGLKRFGAISRTTKFNADLIV